MTTKLSIQIVILKKGRRKYVGILQHLKINNKIEKKGK